LICPEKIQMKGHDSDPHRVPRDRRRLPRRALPAGAKAGGPLDPPKPHDRHAAITDSLSKWQNYKRWTEKIRSTWSPPDTPDE
jgi:hypothetical protein